MNDLSASTQTVQQMKLLTEELVGTANKAYRLDLVRPGEGGWEFHGNTTNDVFLFNFAPFHSLFAMNSDRRTQLEAAGMTYNIHPAGTEIHETDLCQPGESLIVEFTAGVICTQLAQEFGSNRLCRSHLNMTNRRISALAREIQAALWGFRFGKPPVPLLLEGLSLALSATIAEDVLSKPNPSHVLKRFEKQHVRQIQDLIESSLDEKITIERIAAEIGLSPFHIARKYKASTGYGIHEYLVGRRLDRAQLLLRESNKTLAEISYATGFSNQSHMTNTFRKHVGLTPQAYRKMLKQ